MDNQSILVCVKTNRKNRLSLLNYMGNKNYLLDIIHDNVTLNKNNSIFDLFTGSMSISYFLKIKVS